MKTLLAILFVVSLGACNRAEEPNTTHGKLFMLVSDSHLSLLKQEADEFMAQYDQTQVHMAGATTRGAIVAMLNDSVHCICVDRPLNAEERNVASQAGIQIASVRIGRDAVVLVVNDRNTLKSISKESLAGILDGSVTSWKSIPGSKLKGRIELVMMGKNSGLYELVQRHFFHLSRDLAVAKTGDTERQIVRYVAESETSLGIVSLASAIDHPKGARLLAIESSDSTGNVQAVVPSQENIYDALYPLSYSLYLYISEPKLDVGSGFGTFIMTLSGQKIIQEYGLAPEIVPSRTILLKSE